MADEVEGVMLEAVSLHATGHKVVSYNLLGMKPGDVASTFELG
jgi:hypothetical protein